jgi:hypothetical protein
MLNRASPDRKSRRIKGGCRRNNHFGGCFSTRAGGIWFGAVQAEVMGSKHNRHGEGQALRLIVCQGWPVTLRLGNLQSELISFHSGAGLFAYWSFGNGVPASVDPRPA